ncbi:hypothetical protein QAO71_10635 [Halopseudomonas sp. SMJS2]|uniref:hypothetical protein n=1 Tax=Halopseudomonas sp. SMJS2 TaxID=3041098 RepID=UPI002452F604|nr:hypothetical protein [Halopseudomonas sp. SMJS2]WGK60549.1 hypothetical protein QAO71_10635 [Halopseudomonas sp. SMJS2]
MSASQQLVSVDDISESNAPAIYVQGGLKPFIEQVRAEVVAEVPDVTTRKGRERIASLAAKVSKSKVAVEKPGRDYLKRLKEMPKVVEAELREFTRSMDALRDETRRPLTVWEEREKDRIERIQAQVNRLGDTDVTDMSALDIKQSIDNLESHVIDARYEEFEPEAHRVKAASLASLREALAAREKYEAEQAELDELRRKQAEQEQKDREAAIAREAEERARREAEQLAQAEREAAAKREADAKAAADRRELELKLQAEQAEREKLEAQQRAEQAARDAEVKAQAAAEAERQRYLDEQKELARQAAMREADQANKAKVNRAALDAFIAGGMPEDCAKQAVVLIAKRQIPNIVISY